MEENKEHGFGLIPSEYDSRDYGLVMRGNWTEPSFPEEFDLGTIRVKDQGTKSTCAAHVMSEIVEYHYYKENNNKFKRFSTDFVYGSRKPGDYLGEGMQMRDALKTINKIGDVFYTDMPGNTDVPTAMNKVSQHPELKDKAFPNRITSYYRINSENEMKYALMNHGPLAVGMYWYDHADLSNYIYTYDPTDSYTGHAVMIVGWTKDNWIVQNSWGYGWGNGGRFLLPMKNSHETIFEAYGVTDNLQEVRATSKRLGWFYQIINFIVRLFKK